MGFYKTGKIDIKTASIVKEIFLQKGFRKHVARVRRELSLPRYGLDIALFDQLVVKDVHPRIPAKKLNRSEYIRKVKEVLGLYALSFDWFEYFGDYFLFNYIGDIDKEVNQIILLNLGDKNTKLQQHKKMFTNNMSLGTAVIMVPPRASEREILDFIYRNANHIKAIQKAYKTDFSQLTVTRTKNARVQKRNEFIYKNRALPKKKLMATVSDEFGDILDYTYLSKIIVAEARKIKRK